MLSKQMRGLMALSNIASKTDFSRDNFIQAACKLHEYPQTVSIHIQSAIEVSSRQSCFLDPFDLVELECAERSCLDLLLACDLLRARDNNDWLRLELRPLELDICFGSCGSQ